jgi:hypothetical protein
MWSQPAERSKRLREDQNRRQDDLPGRQTVEQNSNARRNKSNCDRSESKRAADCFSLSAEL